MKIIYRYILIFLLLASNVSWAQTFVTKVSSKTIGKRDLLEVQYIAENLELSDFILPRFSSWSIQSGPEFRSNRVQSGNLVKQQIIYSLLLQPLRTGKLSVPSATVVIDKNSTRISNTITVEVKNIDHVAGNISGVTTQRPTIDDPVPDDFTKDQFIRRGENAAAKVKGNLLIKLELSKSSVFVGEPVLATYKLYTRLRSQSRVVKQPAFSGATVVEMTPEEAVPKQERLNGRMYNTYIIRRVQLFPLQAGTLLLPQANVENKITFYKADNVNYRDLYYNPANLPTDEQTVTLSSSSASVEVKALPEAPAGFSGAIGRFKIDAGKLGDQPITTNNNAALVVVIEGPGNLQQIKTPEIQWPKGIEAFDPTDEEETDKTSFPAKIRKTFKFPFIVSQPGNYSIPPVSFVYFDPYASQYVTVSSKGFSFNATPGKKVEISNFNFKEKFGFESRLAVLLGGGLLAIFTGLVLYSRNQKKKTPPVPVKPQTSPVMQEQSFDGREYIHYISNLNPLEDGPGFYKDLHRYITSYLKARFDITTEDIDAIAVTNPDEQTFRRIKSLLNECNLAMYTPLFNADLAIAHRLEAISLLNKLERTD